MLTLGDTPDLRGVHDLRLCCIFSSSSNKQEIVCSNDRLVC